MTNRYRLTTYVSISSAEGFEFIVGDTAYYVEDAIEVEYSWDKWDGNAYDIDVIDAVCVFEEDADNELSDEEWEKVKEIVCSAILDEYQKGKKLYDKVNEEIIDDYNTPD